MKGVELRLKAILEGATIVSHRIFRFEKPREFPAYNPVSAAVVLDDSDLGYLLLTSSPEKPYAALFDSPISPPRSPEVTSYQPDEPPAEVFLDTSLVPRIAYQPPSPFFDPLDHDMQAALNGSASDPRFSASARKAEIKMSSATLGSLTSAHRALSASTGALGGAVAELFTRGHRLHLEFSDQRRMVAKAAERIERLTGDDADENPTSESGRERDGSSDDDSVDETRGPARIEARLEMVERKQAELVKRHEELKKKLARASQRPLADPERAWAEEVAKMGQSVLPPEQEEGQEGESEAAGDDETVDGSPRKQGKDYLERLDEVSSPPFTASCAYHGGHRQCIWPNSCATRRSRLSEKSRKRDPRQAGTIGAVRRPRGSTFRRTCGRSASTKFRRCWRAKRSSWMRRRRGWRG